MAGRTFKLKDASSTGYGTLTEATATAGTMGSGWTVATTTANAFSTMLYGTTRAANTFTTGTDQLSTQANFATGQAWRTDIPIDGTFSSGTNWSLAFSMIAVSTAASQTGRIKVRIWKSSDPVGATANQIQLTIATAAGMVTGTTAAFTKATAATSTVTWTPTGIPAFNNEYLFVSTEWNTVVAGTRAGSDAIFVATAASAIITSDFTPATVQATNADSLTLVETRTGLRTTRSTGADTLVLVDTRTGLKTTQSTGSDTLLFVDTRNGLRTTQSTGSDALTFVETRNGLRTTVSTGADSLTLTDTGTGNRFTQSSITELFVLSDPQNATITSAGGGVTVTGSISESLLLVDTGNARFSKSRSIVSDSLNLTDIRNFVSTSTGSICIPFINPPITLGISALAELPCVPVTAGPANIAETINLVDTTDAILISAFVPDTHDGVRKKKKKKPVSFDEELERTAKLRKQITEVIHPPIAPPLEPEEPQPAEVEPKPLTPLKSLETPITDYADLARQEIVDKIRLDAELKAKEAAEALQRKIQEEIEDEDELEMILEALL